MEQTKKTASYKVTADSGGFAFRFFCDSSGELCCVTRPIRADSEAAALEIAWETEGRRCFNRCEKCGRHVSSAMFNLTAGQCVDCAPWEDEYPTFCHHCGTRLKDPQNILWLCRRTKPDLLLLEAVPDAMERFDDPDKDIAGRCETAARVREEVPGCRVYLSCDPAFRHLEPVMQKAVETNLISGYCFGMLTTQQLELWLGEIPAHHPLREEESHAT